MVKSTFHVYNKPKKVKPPYSCIKVKGCVCQNSKPNQISSIDIRICLLDIFENIKNSWPKLKKQRRTLPEYDTTNKEKLLFKWLN